MRGTVGEPMVMEDRQLEPAVPGSLLRMATHEQGLDLSLRQSEALVVMVYTAEHDLASTMPTTARCLVTWVCGSTAKT